MHTFNFLRLKFLLFFDKLDRGFYSFFRTFIPELNFEMNNYGHRIYCMSIYTV